MSSSISWSALLAVSKQAEEAVGRTTTDVEGAGAGWVADERAGGALGGSPPARADPRAKPAASPTARVTAGARSSHARGVRRGAGNGVTGWGFPPGAGDVVAEAGSGWSGSNSDTSCRWTGLVCSTAAWSRSAAASRLDSDRARSERNRRSASTLRCGLS
jgi:hypothetical protein